MASIGEMYDIYSGYIKNGHPADHAMRQVIRLHEHRNHDDDGADIPASLVAGAVRKFDEHAAIRGHAIEKALAWYDEAKRRFELLRADRLAHGELPDGDPDERLRARWKQIEREAVILGPSGTDIDDMDAVVADGMIGVAARQALRDQARAVATYRCTNCQRSLSWTPRGGWRHADDSERHCNDRRKTFAAPGDRAVCGARWEQGDLRGICQGPADGHRTHATVAARSTTGGDGRLFEPPMTWTVDPDNSEGDGAVAEAGFHAGNGWYFTRTPGGGVHIHAYSGDQLWAAVALDADTWASAVAAVSARGKTDEATEEEAELARRLSGLIAERQIDFLNPAGLSPLKLGVTAEHDGATIVGQLYYTSQNADPMDWWADVHVGVRPDGGETRDAP